MRDIHPHWQEEDDTPVEVRVKEPPTTPVEPDMPSMPSGAAVSRRPAAIVGMLLVIGIGFGFFKGVDGLVGQVAPNGPIVSITDDGIIPERLEVEHGQTITFINNQETPQSIQSNTLCSDTGFCLQTKTLNRGDSDTFTITPDMQSGPYEFMSTSSSDIRGVIIIVTQTVDDFVDLTSVLQDTFIGGDVNTTTPFPDNSAVASNIFDSQPQGQTGIPRNPYTVDSERIHPFDSQGNPIESAFGDEPGSSRQAVEVQAQTTFAQTRGPLTQPQTGPGGILALVAASIWLLWWLTRNAFAQTTL